MADPSNSDERKKAVDAESPADKGEKFDHSDHPTDQIKADDLHAANSGPVEAAPRTRESRAGVHQKEPVVPSDSRHDSNR